MGLDMLDLSCYGITVTDIRRNVSPAGLYVEAIRADPMCNIADSGALIAYSGDKTGRSPSDKRIVDDPLSRQNVWWGNVNVSIAEEVFEINLERAVDYLNTRSHLYVVDAYAG
jgi:phosphoenolpyruvate carboxykinase (ATP)